MSSERPDVVHEFHCEGKKNYYLKGDAKFDQQRFVVKREKLRSSPRLRNAAMQFWETLGLGVDDMMTKDDYTFVHRRITKALAPELEEDEAAEAADEDWLDDLAGNETMTFDLYANGLIGIADLWTETIEELDYIVFLNKLYRRITHVAHTHVTEAMTVAKVRVRRLELTRPA